MRKMCSSGNAWCRVSFSLRAETRSRPNGFSRITRAFLAHPDCRQSLHHHRKHAGRNRQVMRGRLRVAQLGAQAGVRLVVGVVAVDVVHQLAELLEGVLVHAAAVLGDAVAGALAQLLECPSGLGDADDRHIQRAVLDHALQRRKDLLVGKVAGGAEEYKCIGEIDVIRSSYGDYDRWLGMRLRYATGTVTSRSVPLKQCNRRASASV